MAIPWLPWVLLPLAAVLAFLAGSWMRARAGRKAVAVLEARADAHEQAAELARRTAELEARENLQQLRQESDARQREAVHKLDLRERELADREHRLDEADRRAADRDGALAQRESRLAAAEMDSEARLREAQALAEEGGRRLEELAGLSRDAARERVLRHAEEEARSSAARLAAQIRDTAVREAEREARRLLVLVMQRLASDHTIEATVSVVNLPSDDMKGRIIGREGRNIRSFEMATGVDVIIDDTPEAVLLSSFDPIRREVARRALVHLIEDGRIHPGRIEEIVQRVDEEIRTEQRDTGERAAVQASVPGLAPEVVQLLGKLEYRTSFGQNVLRHALEVAHVCGLLASELALDAGLARRIGLLHDVGKALDQDHNGSHAVAGADFLRRYGEAEAVVDAVAVHHGEGDVTTPYGWILQSADAVSGARPGARREKLETYLERIQQLESIANTFPGVDRSFAIQAGRELRILVQGRDVTDGDAGALAASVAGRIEKELQYPGQIKVVVIRETRAVDFAR